MIGIQSMRDPPPSFISPYKDEIIASPVIIYSKGELAMGYISTVTLHITGDKSKFFDVHQAYFQELDSMVIQRFSSETICLNHEEYFITGLALWRWIEWKELHEKKALTGTLYLDEVKWFYYSNQWDKLTRILTKNFFSWQFFRTGQEENDFVESTNQFFLQELFDEAVMEKLYRELPHNTWRHQDLE